MFRYSLFCLVLMYRLHLQFICRGRLRLVVTDVLSRRQLYLDDFTDRKDLINANMASIHIPFFLDYKPFSFYRCVFLNAQLLISVSSFL